MYVLNYILCKSNKHKKTHLKFLHTLHTHGLCLFKYFEQASSNQPSLFKLIVHSHYKKYTHNIITLQLIMISDSV